MKKLSVLLLATVLVFGLVVQAGAQDQGPHVVTVDAFVGDQVITFDDLADQIACPVTTLIDNQYKAEYGVVFSGGLYGDEAFSAFLMPNRPNTAANFNTCKYQTEANIPGEPIMVTFDERVTRVGFIGRSPGGAIIVTTFRGEVEMGSVSFDADSAETFIGIEDTEGIDAIQIEGTGEIGPKKLIFLIDDLTFGGTLDTGPTEVTMNVRPPSCSGASINVKSKGVIPVVIAGQDVDVTMIDPTTILLNGVAPVRSALEDVAYCNNDPDEVLDLTLKFDTQELVDAMEASAEAQGVTLENDDWPTLHLTGSLSDGTEIYADEPVTIRGKPAKENRGSGKMHLRHNKGHHKGWKNHHGWD